MHDFMPWSGASAYICRHCGQGTDRPERYDDVRCPAAPTGDAATLAELRRTREEMTIAMQAAGVVRRRYIALRLALEESGRVDLLKTHNDEYNEGVPY